MTKETTMIMNRHTAAFIGFTLCSFFLSTPETRFMLIVDLHVLALISFLSQILIFSGVVSLNSDCFLTVLLSVCSVLPVTCSLFNLYGYLLLPPCTVCAHHVFLINLVQCSAFLHFIKHKPENSCENQSERKNSVRFKLPSLGKTIYKMIDCVNQHHHFQASSDIIRLDLFCD